jgi:hypothetical protein
MKVHIVIREMTQTDGSKFPVILRGYRSRRQAKDKVFRENSRLELRRAALLVGCVITNRIQEVEVE